MKSPTIYSSIAGLLMQLWRWVNRSSDRSGEDRKRIAKDRRWLAGHLVPSPAIENAPGPALHRAAPLLKKERYLRAQTLVPDLANPIRMHRPGPGPRFAADNHPFESARSSGRSAGVWSDVHRRSVSFGENRGVLGQTLFTFTLELFLPSSRIRRHLRNSPATRSSRIALHTLPGAALFETRFFLRFDSEGGVGWFTPAGL